MELIRSPSVAVVETKPVPEEDRGLLMSIVEPTLALGQHLPGSCSGTAIEIPIGDAAVLIVPVGGSLDGYTTPPRGDRSYSVMYPKRERDAPADDAAVSPPACRLELAPRFDAVVRTGFAADLRVIATDLGGLHFDDETDQLLLERLAGVVTTMADDVLTNDTTGDLGLIPVTRGLRKVVALMGTATRGEVLRDTLRVFSAHAHELSGKATPQENPPSTLALLLSRRRLTGFGVVPASPSASTHGKRRRIHAELEAYESGGPLADLLTSLLQHLVDAESEEPFAPDETVLSIGRAFTAIGAAVVAMSEKVPRLAAAASTLIPRVSNLKEYIMRLPPGLTEQAIAHLQALSAEAHADAQAEKVNPTCIVVIHDLAQSLEKAAGALGLLGDACARLAATQQLTKTDLADLAKRLAGGDLVDLWTGLLWLGDTMAPVVSTVDVIGESLSLLDRCIDHMEKNLHPQEVIQLLGTVMESSMHASRTVAKLVKPGRGSLLPRLVASVAHATELASEARAAVDAAAM